MPQGLFSDLNRLAPEGRQWLVFFHAQRTGGSAFRHILKKVYGRERVYAHQFVASAKIWADISPDDLADYDVFAGHSNYSEKSEFMGRSLYVTLLRDPVYRAASLYFYCQTKEGHKLRELAQTRGPIDFLEKSAKIVPNYICDVQCMRVCGDRDSETAIRLIENTYFAVGDVDHYEAFVAFIAKSLRWRKRPYIETVAGDAEKYRDFLNPEFSALCNELNPNDRRLYDYFNERYFTAGD